MAKTSTVTRTSAHHELKLVSTLLNEDGVDLKDISLMLLLLLSLLFFSLKPPFFEVGASVLEILLVNKNYTKKVFGN